jgi:hypothetical protein
MKVPKSTATTPSQGIEVGGEGSVGVSSPERTTGADTLIFAAPRER